MIIGKNIIIRQCELEDEQYIYKWWNDGNVMSHAGFYSGLMKSREAIKSNILEEVQKGDL